MPQTHEPASLHHYLHVLRRRKWIALQAIIIVPLVAVLFSLQQQHRYASTAEVWLNNKDYTVLLSGGGSSYVSPDRLLATSARLARVPSVATTAIKAARVPARSSADLLDNSSVDARNDADLLEFVVRDPVPADAARLATAYARAYISYRYALDTAQLKRAIAQVRTQVQQLESIGSIRSPLYLTLVQKEQQLQAIQALLTPPILTRPAAGAIQIQPKPLRMGIFGLLLGLVLGLGSAFLRDTLDQRIRSGEEIAERLDLPLLARLPEPPARLRSAYKLSMLEEPDGDHAEAFRVLRTNLDFVNLERGTRVWMVTSALEGEGKSTTTANLAVALTRGGRRVIVVDLDLRRPLLNKLLGVPTQPGLTQVVLGLATLDDALVSLPITERRRARLSALELDEELEAWNGGAGMPAGSNGGVDHQGILQILPAGPLPPNVGEFVGSRHLSALLEQLRERADIVLVDSPPLLGVGDTMALSAKVDALLLVSRIELARRPILKELRRVLDTVPAEKLGFVLTGATPESGYGYGGGYSYGYAPRQARSESAV